MARNGTGTYSLPAGNPVTVNTTITDTWANTTLSDIATALTNSLAKDGQTSPTANLPMATYKHTGVGSASALTDYARADQVQNSAFHWLTSVSGADTITASASITPSAYASGQTFRFTSAGANTGAVTLNVSGLGAKSVTKNGTTALAAGDIPSGAVVEVVYDGTQFQLINVKITVASPSGSITASGYTQNTGKVLGRTTAGSGAIEEIAISSLGSVKQIVYANKTDTFSMSGTTFTDITGLSVSITPTSSSSKILLIAMINVGSSAAADLQNFKFIRDTSTEILIGDTAGTRPRTLGAATPVGATYIENAVLLAVDSPATTSATSYKVQMMTNGGTSYINRSGTDSDPTYSRTVSNIFAVEYQ